MMEDSRSRKDVWASGAADKPYVGRWSRLVAWEFLAWLAVPPEVRGLDVGCGTGALTETILEVTAPASVTGIDRSDGYVSYAREQGREERAHCMTGDTQHLPFDAGTYDSAVSGLGFNFVPQPERAVAEWARVTRPGGTGACSVGDHAAEMQLMRYFWNAAVALDPAAGPLDEGRRFPICQPEPLTAPFTVRAHPSCPPDPGRRNHLSNRPCLSSPGFASVGRLAS